MTSHATLGKRAQGRRSEGGFTLIELMIVCAIVAILAAVAYPSYRDSVLKGRRAEGRTAVLDLLQQQERFLTQSNSYMAFSPGQTGPNGTTAAASGQSIPFKTSSGSNLSSSAYRVGARTCQLGTQLPATLRECVEVFAEPMTAGSDPKVDTLWASSAGLKGCTGTDPAACWK